MKNQEHNNNLDELFNKAKASKQSLDDFEKDAFAGFEMLDSEQEAKDLKAALDTRINNELFKKEEKNNPKIYWLAAAGLALVIGLAVLFVSNSNEAISSGSNLAISNVEEKSEETLPDSKTELKEQNVAPVEAEAAITTTDQSPAKEPIELKVAEELKNNEPIKGVKTGEKEMTSRMIVPAVKSEASKDGLFEGEKDKKETDQTERRKENNMGTGSNTSGGYFKDVDDLAKNDKSKEKISADQNFAGTATNKPNQNKQASEDMEVNVQDELASNESSKKGKADGKTKTAELEQEYKTPILANNNTTNSSSRENSKSKNRSKAKKSSEKSSMAGPEDSNNYPGTNPKTTTPEIAGEVNAVPAEAETKALTATTACYYTGGDVALTKDIKEKLKAENIDQKFDATLYINEKKIVEKVEFTNSYDLTSKQKEEVTKILKSLNKFNVPSTGKKESFTYKILYRP